MITNTSLRLGLPLFILCLLIIACQGQSPATYDAEYFFIDDLSSKTARDSNKEIEASFVEIGFDRRPSLVMQPPSEHRFHDIPSAAGARFETAIGMIPKDSFEPTCEIDFQALCTQDDGAWIKLLEDTLTPEHITKDRAWTEQAATLDRCSRPTTTITLRTSSGQECTSGKAVWGDPRIVRQRAFVPSIPRIALLISIDTLRPDRLSIYGNQLPTSPELERLAADAVVFETTLASAPWTIPSHATMLTSTYPQVHRTTRQSPLPEALPSLAQALQQAGWQTAGFVDSGFLNEEFGFHRGFDHFDDDYPYAGLRIRGARLVRQRLINWLEHASASPTFVFWHIMDAHGPYGAPGPFAGRYRSSVAASAADSRLEELQKLDYHRYLELERFSSFADLIATYDEGVLAIDDVVGGFLGLLRSCGLYDDALIIVTSDHGESFYDHEVWVGHGLFLTEDEIRVPLIVKLPGNRHAGLRVKEMAGLIDIAPTILDVLGVPAPASFQGSSLISPEPGAGLADVLHGFSSNTGAAYVRTRRYKYIEPPERDKVLKALRPQKGAVHTSEIWEQEQLYDLARDADERSPISSPDQNTTIELERLRNLAAEHKAQSKVIGEGLANETRKPLLHEEDVERLRALGYMTDKHDNVYNLIDNLEQARIVAPGENHVMSTHFKVAGELRPVLFQHPDSEIIFPALEIGSAASMLFGIGINEEVWDRGGDGVLFEVVVSAREDNEQKEQTVYSRYLDPKNRPEDRRWVDQVVDLKPFADKLITITLRTSSGPAGDMNCDWAGWSEPTLLP